MRMMQCEALLEVITNGIKMEIIAYDSTLSSQICSFRSSVDVILFRNLFDSFVLLDISPDFLGSVLILIHLVTCSIR